MHRMWRAIGHLAAAALFSGCTSELSVRPEVEAQPIGEFRIPARIVFDGNRDYLPRVLEEGPARADGLVVDYRYQVVHKNTDIDAIALFNPLSIVGFPSGSNELTLLAELKILRQGTLLKDYRAACTIEQQTGLWSFRTVTDMRREGLIALRDNIESQLVRDKKDIETLALTQ